MKKVFAVITLGAALIVVSACSSKEKVQPTELRAESTSIETQTQPAETTPVQNVADLGGSSSGRSR